MGGCCSKKSRVCGVPGCGAPYNRSVRKRCRCFVCPACFEKTGRKCPVCTVPQEPESALTARALGIRLAEDGSTAADAVRGPAPSAQAPALQVRDIKLSEAGSPAPSVIGGQRPRSAAGSVAGSAVGKAAAAAAAAAAPPSPAPRLTAARDAESCKHCGTPVQVGCKCSTLYSYEEELNTGRLPIARRKDGEAEAEDVPTQIVVVGGVEDDNISSSMQVCDCLARGPAWGSLGIWDFVNKPLAWTRKGHCAVAVDDTRIIVLGGVGETEAYGTLQEVPVMPIEMFDAQHVSKGWVEIARMPEPRINATAVYMEGRVYIVGGKSCENGVALASTLVFDVEARSFLPKETVPALGQGRENACGAVLNGRVHVAGGESEGIFLDSVEALDLRTQTWLDMPPMLVPRTEAACCVVNNAMVVCGGRAAEGLTNKVEFLEGGARRWLLLHANMLLEIRQSVALAAAGKIWVVGGFGPTAAAGRGGGKGGAAARVPRRLREVQVYDPYEGRWAMATPMHSRRSLFAAAVVHA
eukprot:tig00000865_g5089.t1